MSGTKSQSLGGLVVATALPYRADAKAPAGLAVDYDAYAEHCRWLVGNGCRGVGPNGSLGEYSALTGDERRRVARTAVEALDGDGIVIAGVHGPGSHQARHWTEIAAEDGADGVLCLPPTMYRANRADIIAHYEAVASVGLPVMVYNNPLDTKVDLTPDLLAEIAQIDNVTAVKEFSGDVRRVLEIIEKAPGLEVVSGADDVALESLLMGATGWFAGFPNVFPAESAQLCDLALAGKLAEAATCTRCSSPRSAGTRGPSSSRPSSSAWTRPGGTAASAARRAARSPPTPAPPSPPTWPAPSRRSGTGRPPDALRPLDQRRRLAHGGMPTRVVTGGVPPIPGDTMAERRDHAVRHLDGLRRFRWTSRAATPR